MPDKDRKTISASQVAALFNCSPYLTRRALFDWAHDGVDIDANENRRMSFGKLIQPFIMEITADEFALETEENKKDDYRRHPKLPLGATIDGTIRCPTRGLGLVECKSISYRVFKETWTDTKAPLAIELQLQAQLLVTGYSWGVISALIGADEDRRFFERKPDKEVFKRLMEESKAFMADVKAHRRPPVSGHPIEMRGLEALYPVARNDVIYDKPKDDVTGQLLRDFLYHRNERLFHSKAEDQLKIKILDVAKDASRMVCYGAEARISKTPMREQKITKTEHTRVSINVQEREETEPLPDVGAVNWGAG